MIRRTSRAALRPVFTVRRPIRLSAASSESFRAFAFCFADRRADAHPPDEVARLQSRTNLTCPPFSSLVSLVLLLLISCERHAACELERGYA